MTACTFIFLKAGGSKPAIKYPVHFLLTSTYQGFFGPLHFPYRFLAFMENEYSYLISPGGNVFTVIGGCSQPSAVETVHLHAVSAASRAIPSLPP